MKRVTVAVLVACALSGCASDMRTAAESCRGVSDDVAGECIANHMEAADRRTETILLLLTAGMVGFNEGRGH